MSRWWIFTSNAFQSFIPPILHSTTSDSIKKNSDILLVPYQPLTPHKKGVGGWMCDEYELNLGRERPHFWLNCNDETTIPPYSQNTSWRACFSFWDLRFSRVPSLTRRKPSMREPVSLLDGVHTTERIPLPKHSSTCPIVSTIGN